MSEQTTRAILAEIACALAISPDLIDRVVFVNQDRLPSCFAVSELAAASVAAAGLAISDLISLSGVRPSVAVDQRLASLWFGFSIHPQGWKIAAAWDDLAGDYRTNDGWIRLHTNASNHRAAALAVLGSDANRNAASAAVQTRQGSELEDAIIAAGGCAAALRSQSEWMAHPQGSAIGSEQLIHWDDEHRTVTPAWKPSSDRPLAGLRVLDLTRVLAGPVATRFLAGYGAEVLRIDPPDWDEPGVIPEVTLGKRCARLDLRQTEGRDIFKALLSQTDIFVHGLRADALDRLGLSSDVRQAIRPGLIDISLNAYGHSGQWTNRRGFDSLVQFSSGIAHEGMLWKNSNSPVSLPVQALDQSTGYLLAAAAIRAVSARLRGEPNVRARLSLARTAHLLQQHGNDANSAEFHAGNTFDLSDTVENTYWGSARRFKSPILIEGCPQLWDSPAVPLGSASAIWL